MLIHIKVNGYYVVAYELVYGGIKLRTDKNKKKASLLRESDYKAMTEHVKGNSQYKIEKEDVKINN